MCFRDFLARIRVLLLGVLLSAGASAFGQSWGVVGENSSSSPLLDTPAEFLPVEEAYQLNVLNNAEGLTLDWLSAPGYYLYKDKFSFTATQADGQTLELSANYPPGQRIYDEFYEKELEVFYGTLMVRLSVPDQLGDQDWTLSVVSQGCADAGLCYPPRTQYFVIGHGAATIAELASLTKTDISSSVNTSTGDNTVDTAIGDTAIGGAAPTFAVVLFFALLGGVILNLMPCVFPVLSIKVLSLTSAHLGEHNKHMHGLAYTAGIVLSFIAIAALLLVFRQAGEAVGWGFQLQSPVFVSLLAYLFFAVGLSFSGILVIGAHWMNFGQSTAAGTSLRSSFMTGVLATVVASPCSAPFMGTALGVALAQPPLIGLSVFAVLGVGMALPFVLLSWVPGLLEKLPAPGPWMETFRQFLAFPLYASAVWLLWVLGRQTSVDHAALIAIGILLLAFAVWLGGGGAGRLKRMLALAVTLAALALAFTPSKSANEALWEPYSRARLDTLRDEGRPVFVNLTADWCITCLANEKMALNSNAFASILREKNIAYLKGDWTNRNAEITRLLKEYGRSGVPLYLYYSVSSVRAEILPQLLTQSLVLEVLNK